MIDGHIQLQDWDSTPIVYVHLGESNEDGTRLLLP